MPNNYSYQLKLAESNQRALFQKNVVLALIFYGISKCDQSLKVHTITNYDSRLLMKVIFKSVPTTLECFIRLATGHVNMRSFCFVLLSRRWRSSILSSRCRCRCRDTNIRMIWGRSVWGCPVANGSHIYTQPHPCSYPYSSLGPLENVES